jgi:hypothetical protein
VLEDIVVDTNVLLHADDTRQPHQADASALLQHLLDGTTALCVDDGFDVDESRNKSLIGGEYFSRLNATHTATAVTAHLFATGRVELVSRTVSVPVKKVIEQCVRKKRDRTFLQVAHNSIEAVLCSQDFEDMQKAKRKHLRDKAGVEVLEVGAACSLVAPG